MKILLAALALAMPMTASSAAANPVRPPEDHYTAFTVTVQSPPAPVVGADGKKHLAYELLILNWQRFPSTIERIEVLDADRGNRVLADFSGPALDAVTSSILQVPGRVVAPGTMHKAVLDVQLAPSARPRTLVHRFTTTTDPEIPLFASPFLAARTAVSQRSPVVLAPPLRGPGWVHLTGCCAPAAHRTILQGINGTLSLGQRFAYDTTQLTPDGRLFDGPQEDVHSYPAYGAPIHAVADGTVVAAVDGMPDQIPFRPTEPGEPATVSGNNVVLDIGGGRYAYFAHMSPGSVRVAVGQRVRAGQVLGLVGNSGNSDLPHVHFQIMDNPSMLGSEGLPFVFRSFDSPGSVPPLDQIDLTGVIPIKPELAGRHRTAVPMILQVIDYPVE
jgi:murein DD-endopeptidase MepM/ murein hydrolase activator NlpD